MACVQEEIDGVEESLKLFGIICHIREILLIKNVNGNKIFYYIYKGDFMRRNTSLLLILFVLAFLGMQTFSFMSELTRHEERVAKLEKQAIQFETKGTYIDLKTNPAVELRKENERFRAEVFNFALKVVIITGAAVFVLIMMRRVFHEK